MHHFKVYKQDDKYVYEEVEAPEIRQDSEDDPNAYWDWVNENDILLVDDDKIPELLCVEYNGEFLPYLQTWQDIEDEFEDPLVEALKKDEYYHEIEFADDPADDDQVYEWQVFHPQVILLSK
jgi:hypothetical protein